MEVGYLALKAKSCPPAPGPRVGNRRDAFRRTDVGVNYLHSISGPELAEGVPVDMKSRKKVDATAA